MRTVSDLQKRLRAIVAAYQNAPRPRTDSVKRIAMMQTLDAIIIHLEAKPSRHAADTALLIKLVDFLYDAENGHSTSWAVPKTGHRPKGKRLGITARRAMAAAEMQKLMNKGMSRKDAARKVWRQCAPGLSGDRRESETPVARWREWIMSGPSDSIERQIYDAELKKN